MGPPQPKTVMAASAKQVLRRLDNVDDRLKGFFEPAAKLVMAQSDPEDALCRALAAMSGIIEVPKPRRYKRAPKRLLIPSQRQFCIESVNFSKPSRL